MRRCPPSAPLPRVTTIWHIKSSYGASPLSIHRTPAPRDLRLPAWARGKRRVLRSHVSSEDSRSESLWEGNALSWRDAYAIAGSWTGSSAKRFLTSRSLGYTSNDLPANGRVCRGVHPGPRVRCSGRYSDTSSDRHRRTGFGARFIDVPARAPAAESVVPRPETFDIKIR